MQVILNNESVITGLVLVGGSPDGIEVSEIPQTVMDNPSAWKYINGRYLPIETAPAEDTPPELQPAPLERDPIPNPGMENRASRLSPSPLERETPRPFRDAESGVGNPSRRASGGSRVPVKRASSRRTRAGQSRPDA